MFTHELVLSPLEKLMPEPGDIVAPDFVVGSVEILPPLAPAFAA
jgi:hypothetical protein